MVVSEIKLFELLKAKIGEKEAEAFVEILETRVDKKFEDSKNELATKKDIADLRVEMANIKVDIIKWVVALIIGLYIALIGSIAAIFKLMI